MIRLILASVLILPGLLALGAALLGVYRFSTMLNRVHAAAACDTLGAFLVLLGLAVLSGWNGLSLKLLLTLLFLWLSSPVASHLIVHAEVRTQPHLAQSCDLMEIDRQGKLREMDLTPPDVGDSLDTEEN